MKAASPTALAPVKCLVVDDLPDNLFTMSALLSDGDDVEVLTASSGPAALELLLVHDVALALLDVQMPGMDGFELAELIRGSDRTRHIPLIFVTAAAREPSRLFKGYDAGAVDFLFKPVEPWLLLSKVRVFFDLYRARQVLDAELEARTEALRLNEMFQAVLAHDLRDPLAAMLMSARLIEQQASTDGMRSAAQRLMASGDSMRRMITDLLDVTRARQSGGLALTRAPTDIAAIVERVLREQRLIHPERTVVEHLDGDLRGQWDGGRLGQVLSNLLANAIAHGRRTEAVELMVDGRTGDHVRIQVSNAGEIDPELLPHVFEPFRAGGGTLQRGGLGLGLYIVRQIVASHGGTVDVVSTNDRTKFTVSLPRR